MAWTYHTLPTDDNLNPYSYCIEVTDQIFIKKGKMIGYYGQLRFEALGTTAYADLVQKAFGAPAYAGSFVIVTGRGKLILGDNGNDIASYKLEKGILTVRAANVLGFTRTLRCQESTLPGYLSLIGDGTFLASSNGPVHFMQPPVSVDAQALLGWADCPCPSYRYDYSHVSNVLGMVGTLTGVSQSGEEKQIEFSGQGDVLVQSSEEPLGGQGLLQDIVNKIPGLGQTEITQLGTIISQRLRGA